MISFIKLLATFFLLFYITVVASGATLTKSQQKSYAAAMTGLTVARTCNSIVGGHAGDVSFFKGPAAKGRKFAKSLGAKSSLIASVERKHRTRLAKQIKSKSESRQKAFCNREVSKWRRKVRHK